MPLKYAPYLILALGAVVVGVGLWRQALFPPKVVSTGVVKFVDRNGTTLLFPKRVLSSGGVERVQIQLPGETWIDCSGDCAEAIRAEHTEIWETRMLKGH